jgi:hypothetical protein
MVLIFHPPNAHVRISWIFLRNAMAAAAVKKIYWGSGVILSVLFVGVKQPKHNELNYIE